MGNRQKKQEGYVYPQDQVTRSSGYLGTIFLAAAAVLFIAVSVVVLFVKSVSELYLTYMVSAILIAFGIGLIVKYFVTEAYRSMHDYGFSGGALVVVLGACGLARAEQVCAQMAFFVGLLVMAVAMVMLQQALQLHIMRERTWAGVLVISLLTLFAAVLLLFDIGSVTERVTHFAYWVLLAAGVLTLICMVISGIGVKLFAHTEKKELGRMRQEQERAFTREQEKKRLEGAMKKIEAGAHRPSSSDAPPVEENDVHAGE